MEHFDSLNAVDVHKILKDLPLFRKLKADDFKTLEANLAPENFENDKPIIKEGDAGDKFYIIAQGKVSVRKGAAQLAQLGKGDYFGEAALLSDAKRLASVFAVGKVQVLSLSRAKFTDLFQSGSKLKVAFAKRQAISAETKGAGAQSGYTPVMPAGATKEKTEQQKQFILGAVQYNVLFMNLTPEHTRALIDEMYRTEIKKGTNAIVQGDAGDNLYVVESGEFEVFVNGTRVAVRGLNTCFGELALMYNSPRAATVTAAQDSVVWVVDRFTFKRVITDVSSKAMNEAIGFLNNVDLLAPLSTVERSKIAEALEEMEVPAGTQIILEAAEGDAMYLVKSGTLDCTKAGKSVLTLTTGGYFGERALLNNAPRAATVTAATDCKLLRLDRTAFHLLLGPLQEIMKSNISTQDQEVKKPEAEHKAAPPRQKFTIPLADLKRIAILGKGSFGTVWLCQDAKKVTYALKSISKNQIVQTGQQGHIMNEKKAMEDLDHPMLIKLYTTYKDDNSLYFLLEPIMGGELFSYLRDKTLFEEHVAKFYASNVVLAFEHMHDRNYVYRDLKPENLLINRDGYLKITDFGFAKDISAGRTYTLCGTPDYLAPEIVASKGHGKGVDWWTCGIFIYEMLASYPPFADDDPMKTYAKILHGSIAYPTHFSKEAVSIIKKLLHPQPHKRLGVVKGGAKLIKKHPWFKGFDWQGCFDKELETPYKPVIKSETDVSNFDLYDDEDEEDQEPYQDDGSNWDAEF